MRLVQTMSEKFMELLTLRQPQARQYDDLQLIVTERTP